ncbi:hypothetical protein V502_06683 [Pseudogymnoascus sp. VKM F-4520 (FW-2644)]|nr:hypothetical protein V502_06683 [Pseudogymnoascus sp. VKM F-4520 (FW-2644)]
MRFAIILAAASATLVAAQDFSKCSNTQALVDCATPFSNAITDCGTKIDCICKNATGAFDCFEKYCPEEDFPYQSTVDSQCGTGSVSSGDATSTGTSASSTGEPLANDNTSGDKKSGGGDTGAGASLFAPAGGLLAAIVAVAAML